MKKIFILTCAAAMVAALATSCESKSKLANDIQGTWTSAPDRMANVPGVTATGVRTFRFDLTGGTNGGEFSLTTEYTIETAVPGPTTTEVNVPIQLTADGTSTVSGTWVATDDDEVLVSLDPTTLTVTVAPEGVSLVYNELNGDSQPETEALVPAAVAMTKQQITALAKDDMAKLSKIDDVKFHDGLMSCEINHRDFTFRRAQ